LPKSQTELFVPSSPSLASASRILDAAAGIVAAPGAMAGLYLAALSVPARLRVYAPDESIRLAVVVPAHNEAADIQETVASLLATTYPNSHRRVVVVADNCTDNTATLARTAGAEVLERHNLDQRGKGYALEFAFQSLIAEGNTDAVVVVDADTVVSRNLLTSCAARLRAGELAVQVDYQVRNADTSWRTRLLHIAFTAFHEVRSTGRERFGVSCGLRGNGMAFSITALQRVPHAAFSIVEDLEYGIALGRAGIRVAYAHDAWVQGHMPSDAKSSESQRDRWEGGRTLIRQRHGRALASSAVRNRDKVLGDLAADVLVPPLGQLGASLVAASVITTAGSLVSQRVSGRGWLSPFVAVIGVSGFVLHVAEGWRRSGTGVNGLLDLVRAPVYVVWKLGRRLASRNTGAVPDEWVRTQRSDQPEGTS
jgi:1,2-diacylglycerol 3-beta-glucosyltransferase